MEILDAATRDPELGAAALPVLIQIIRHSDWKTGRCYPSQSTIGKAIGITQQAVGRQIQVLVKRGYLQKSQRRLESGANTSCEYLVKLPGTQQQEVVTPTTPCCDPPQHHVVAINVLQSERITPYIPPFDFSEEFEKLWTAWKPVGTLKGNRHHALKNYHALRLAGRSREQISAASERYCRDCAKTGAYTKHVHTWLKEFGYEDHAAPPPAEGELSSGSQSPAKPRLRDQPWKKSAREILGEDIFRSWLSPCWLEGSVMHCPTRFMRDWNSTHYKTDLARAIGHAITFTADPPPPHAFEQGTEPASVPSRLPESAPA